MTSWLPRDLITRTEIARRRFGRMAYGRRVRGKPDQGVRARGGRPVILKFVPAARKRSATGHVLQRIETLLERKMHRIVTAFTKRMAGFRKLLADSDGSVFVEYLLLLTLVGIGVIVGLAAVRTALIDELVQLAGAIATIHP